MKKRTLTLEEAARVAGVAEEELRTALKDGLIQAVRLENTGLYHLEEAELERYLRRTRKWELSERGPSRRVLIIDDDARYAETLRLQLQRDDRIEARVSSWGKDAIALLHEYKPHLCLLGWRAPDPRLSLVVDVLGMRGVKRQTRLLAYGGNTTRVAWGEEPDDELGVIGIKSLFSKARGAGELAQACYAELSLEPLGRPLE